MFAILIPHLAPNPFPKSKLVIVLKRRFFSVASFLVDGMVSLIFLIFYFLSKIMAFPWTPFS